MDNSALLCCDEYLCWGHAVKARVGPVVIIKPEIFLEPALSVSSRGIILEINLFILY